MRDEGGLEQDRDVGELVGSLGEKSLQGLLLVWKWKERVREQSSVIPSFLAYLTG